MSDDNKDDLIRYPKLLTILDTALLYLGSVSVSERHSSYVSSGWRTLEDIIYDIEEIKDELECCIDTYRDLRKIYKRACCTMRRGATWINGENFDYHSGIKLLEEAYIAARPYAQREFSIDSDIETFKELAYRLR